MAEAAEVEKETPQEETVQETEKVSEEVVEEAVKGSWPEDWRQLYAKKDEKLAKRLERYSSPEAALDAHLALLNRINSGEFLPKYPKGGSEDEVKKWRSEVGVPEKAEGYELKLKDGTVPGEEDLEMINAFKEVAHTSNYTPDQLNRAVEWYYATKEQETQARYDADEKIREEVEDKLRLEWGTDFRKNKSIIEAYLDTGPEGTKDKFLGARLSDGTPLASDLEVLRFLSDKAREYNPAITLVPGEGASQIQSIDDELSELKRYSAAPKESREWKKYWREGGESRYRELLDAKIKLSRKTG
jgi:hypothetical protein